MKKNILFISLLAASLLQSYPNTHQDTDSIFDAKLESVGRILNMANVNEGSLALIQTKSDNVTDGYEQRNNRTESKTPTRIEKQTFSNVTKVEFYHQYGNIVIKETNLKQIELEIQYFDTDNDRASCETSVTKGLLSIKTNKVKNNQKGQGVKINYIINMPRHFDLSINLKYGNVNMGTYSGAFSSNLSYSNLHAQSLEGTTTDINMKYGNLTVENINKAKIISSYSSIKINKLYKLEISGSYNNYDISYANSIFSNEASGYNKYKIGEVNDVDLELKYSGLNIGHLDSSLQVSLAQFSPINIGSVSTKLKKINIDGSYSNISISLPANFSIMFDCRLYNGDLNISEKHTVKYMTNSAIDLKVLKKGQIGTKKTIAEIDISGNYSNIKIK